MALNYASINDDGAFSFRNLERFELFIIFNFSIKYNDYLITGCTNKLIFVITYKVKILL